MFERGRALLVHYRRAGGELARAKPNCEKKRVTGKKKEELYGQKKVDVGGRTGKRTEGGGGKKTSPPRKEVKRGGAAPFLHKGTIKPGTEKLGKKKEEFPKRGTTLLLNRSPRRKKNRNQWRKAPAMVGPKAPVRRKRTSALKTRKKKGRTGPP